MKFKKKKPPFIILMTSRPSYIQETVHQIVKNQRQISCTQIYWCIRFNTEYRFNHTLFSKSHRYTLIGFVTCVLTSDSSSWSARKLK